MGAIGGGAVLVAAASMGCGYGMQKLGQHAYRKAKDALANRSSGQEVSSTGSESTAVHCTDNPPDQPRG